MTRTARKRYCRRNAIEPKDGHLKSDHQMFRCFLRGLAGDAINFILAAAGCDLQKLLQRLFFVTIFPLLAVAMIRITANPPREQNFVVARDVLYFVAEVTKL